MLKKKCFLLNSIFSLSANFRLELVEPSARERRAVGERGEEKRTWLKPSETRNKVRAKKTVDPQPL